MTLGEALAAMWQQWMLDLVAHTSLEGAALGLGVTAWVVTMTALGVWCVREASK